MRKVWKELDSLMLLVAAILITITLVPVGILHNTVMSIVGIFQVRFWLGVWKFIVFWAKVLYQIWAALKYLMRHVAIALDLIWNATSGELIEDIVTEEEETLYGKGDITISAATGELETKEKLNKNGVLFTKLLSKVLGENHSIEAYNSTIKK